MNSKKLPLSSTEGEWTIGIGWTRKLVITGAVLNVTGLSLIILNVLNFTPLTLLASVSISGVLMGVSVLLYIIVVIGDLIRRGVLS